MRVDGKAQRNLQKSVAWGSRTFAVVILMVIPGLVGLYLDSRWGTQFLVFIGLLAGCGLGTVGLVMLVKMIEIERKQSEADQTLESRTLESQSLNRLSNSLENENKSP